MIRGLAPKLYIVTSALLLSWYLVMEVRGAVFSGTDARPPTYAPGSGSSSSGGGGGGGGVFFWGSGYRGGK